MAEQVAALSGVCVVGRFLGVSGGNFPFLEIECTYRDVATGNLKSGQRRVGIRAYGAGTGEPTAVGKQLETVQPGDRIGVEVFVECKPPGVTKEGKAYGAFATYEATSILVLK